MSDKRDPATATAEPQRTPCDKHLESAAPDGCGVRAWPVLAVVFAVSWLLYHNTVINNVYVFGGSTDVLTISGFLWRADVALHGAPAIDARSFFGQHFSPLLIPFGLASHFFALDHVQWFAVVVGLWHAFTTTVVASVVQRAGGAYHCRPSTAAVLALVAGLGFALTSLHAGFAYLPHFEILIPGFLILALAVLAQQAYGLAGIAVLALFLTREDGGLHLATLCAALALVIGLQERRWPRTWLWLTVLGTAAWLFEFWIRPKLAPHSISLMEIIYLGDPPLAHVSWAQTLERLRFYALESGYIWGPLAVLLLGAALRRDLRYAAAVLAVLPWIVLHLVIARSASAAMMAGYYAFPVVTALAWPSIVALLPHRSDSRPRPGFATWLVLQAGVLLAASIPPVSMDPLNFGSRSLWYRYTLVDAAHAAPAYRAFGRALERGRTELGELATTINASLFAPWVLKREEWSEDFDARGRDLAVLKTFLAFDHPFPCDAAEAFAERAALPYRYTVPGTRIIVLSRLRLGQLPSFASILVPKAHGPLCGTPIREGRRPP